LSCSSVGRSFEGFRTGQRNSDCWLQGYQIQSFVSIDQPALAATHWLLAGGVVVLGARPELRIWHLRGAAHVVTRGRREVIVAGAEPTSPVTLVGSAVVLIVALAALVVAMTPLRADMASRRGSNAFLEGDGNAALEAYTAATRIAPYESVYWSQRGGLLEQVKRPDLALEAYLTAISRDPRAHDVYTAAIRVANDTGQTGQAQALRQRLLRLDPRIAAS
jgi:tetratricopeptide (TPR) repeat protein